LLGDATSGISSVVFAYVMTMLFNSMLCCSCYEEKLEHETSQKKNQEKEKETKPKKKGSEICSEKLSSTSFDCKSFATELNFLGTQ